MSAGKTKFVSPIRRISIVNFTGIRANWGCQATSWELLKFLNGSFPGADLPMVSLIPLLPRFQIDKEMADLQLDRIYESIVTVSTLNQRNRKRMEAISYLEHLCIERYGKYADEVRNSDIVFFEGEGTMTGLEFLQGARLMLLPFVARHAWGKPVYSLNQTIFLGDEQFAEALVAAYNTFDFVAVRENISLNAARHAGIEPVFHIPDTAFLTVPAADDRLPQLGGDKYFMITGTAYFSPDAHEQIFAAADRLRNETELIPVIAASTGPDRKLETLASKYWRKNSYEVIPAAVSYSSVAFAMRKCRFLLSGRYHMTIMAASVGLPAIQLPGNTYKNEGLSAMLGGLFPVMNAANPDLILKAAQEILAQEPFIHSRLRSARDAILQSLSEASEWLKGDLSDRRSAFPPSFFTPPGQDIEAAAHMDPYRSKVIDHAKTFDYPPIVGDGLGPKPHGSHMLPCLFSSSLGGDTRALPAIKQILLSYPDAIDQVDASLRSELSTLLADGSAPASTGAGPATFDYEIPYVNYLMGSTLADMTQKKIDGEEQEYSYGTRRALSSQIEMLRKEFVGTWELTLYHAILIVLIRRNIRLEDNLERFFTLWHLEGEFLRKNLDSRWLISACDTIVDHSSDQSERALAMAASLFTNTVKLYETERWATGQRARRQSYQKISGRVALYDGLSAFLIGNGDMVRNLQRRVQSFSGTDSVAAPILHELMARTSRFDTVFKRFAEQTDKDVFGSRRACNFLRRLFR